MKPKTIRLSTLARQARNYLAPEYTPVLRILDSQIKYCTCYCLTEALLIAAHYEEPIRGLAKLEDAVASYCDQPTSLPWWPTIDAKAQNERFMWLCLLEQVGKNIKIPLK
jgi:hypothetical protein